MIETEHLGYEVIGTTAVVTMNRPERKNAANGTMWRELNTVFDDIAAGVLPVAGVAAYTGELTVRYLAPVPIEEPLEFRARIDAHEGRKLRASADCSAAGRVVATAEVLYITVDTAAFGRSEG